MKIQFAAVLLLFSLAARAADVWTDISSTLFTQLTNSGVKIPWPGGCSGVVADRLTGAVTVKVIGNGLWRTTDTGAHWARIDGGVVSGRDETGWTTTADQNAPGRIVSFSLDGDAGWTTNGIVWRKFATLGRNWDFGSVDWASPSPQTIIAAKHETTPPGEVYLSTDGGNAWRLLPIRVSEKRDKISMVGAMDASTLIYGKGDGIYRSADLGLTWSKVSDENPQTRVPVLFQGRHYLGTAAGLLVSDDRGATWRIQGAPESIWQGPFFGATAADIAVVGQRGVFISRDAGLTWTKAADLKPKSAGFEFLANWFGCYAWDSKNHSLLASAMGNSVYSLQLP
jgi:hypothetical protein